MDPQPPAVAVRPAGPADFLGTVGGVALADGVIMFSAQAFAIAVRRPTGEVVVRRRALPRGWLWRRVRSRWFEALGHLLRVAFLFVLGHDFCRQQAEALAGEFLTPSQRRARRLSANLTALSVVFAPIWAIAVFLTVVPSLPAYRQMAASRGTAVVGFWGGIDDALVLLLTLACAGSLWLVPAWRRLMGHHQAVHQVLAAAQQRWPLDDKQAGAFVGPGTPCRASLPAVLLTALMAVVGWKMVALVVPAILHVERGGLLRLALLLASAATVGAFGMPWRRRLLARRQRQAVAEVQWPAAALSRTRRAQREVAHAALMALWADGAQGTPAADSPSWRRWVQACVPNAPDPSVRTAARTASRPCAKH